MVLISLPGSILKVMINYMTRKIKLLTCESMVLCHFLLRRDWQGEKLDIVDGSSVG